MDEQQETDLACQLKNGSIDAWNALYETYSRRVWCMVARLMGSQSADIADVVQETFMAAASSTHTYDAGRGSLWSWLGGIARRQVALYYRKQGRQPSGEPGDPTDNRCSTPDDFLAEAELAEIIRGVLRELPSDYESVLTSKYSLQQSIQQMAAQQRCSQEAIRSRLARARRAFRRAMKKHTSEFPEGYIQALTEPPK